MGEHTSLKMWLWVTVWPAFFLFVNGTFDFGFFRQQREHTPMTAMNCFEYSKFSPLKIRRVYDEGRRYSSGFSNNLFSTFRLPMKRKANGVFSRRIDIMRSTTNDILKEHSKLVDDINGMKQLAFVTPIKDDSSDYDESIFHEIIETLPESKVKKMPRQPNNPSPSPLILAGGESNYHEIKRKPAKFVRPVVNLVGTTASPVKHPYPFVQATSIRPIRICMPSLLSTYATTTERPSLWETLLRIIIPK